MISINQLIIFLFLLFVEFFFCSLNGMGQFLVIFHIHTTRKGILFLKLVYFFTGLAGRFHNFELTQNREKTRNGLM
jgi:hypothetical protein